MRSKVKGRFDPLTDFEIEEYLCGDLSDDAAARVEKAMGESPALKAYIVDRRAEKEAFAVRHPRLPSLQPNPRGSLRWAPWFASAAVAAAAVVAVVWVGDGPVPGSVHRTAIRARGTLKVSLMVKREGRAFVHRAGVPLRPGDQVRLTVEAPSPGFLTVLGQEQAGAVSVYHDGVRTTAGSFTVPGSLVLDDYVGEEAWFIILAPQHLPADEYIQTLRAGEHLAGDVAVLRLLKEEQR